MPADLQSLCRALRTAGFRLGVDEELRLAASIEGLSPADGAILRDIVAAIVLKAPAAAADFDRVYASWLQAQRPHHTRAQRALAPALAGFSPVAPQRPRFWMGKQRWLRGLGLLGVLVLGAAIVRLYPFSPQPAPHASADLGTAPLATNDLGAAAQVADDGEKLAETFVTQVPEISVQPARTPLTVWLWGVLTLVATAGLAAIWLVARRRRMVPDPAPLPSRAGLRRVLPVAHLAKGSPSLMLTPEESEALIWRIGRFVAEDATGHLDLATTIAATAAAAGRPELRFQRARYPRAVWLWVDRALTSRGDGQAAGVEHLVKDLASSLNRSGLPVERAVFWGVPERLESATGAFLPSEVDERRDSALIVVFTDGRLLTSALRSGRTRVPTQALLRQLAHFPQLAFVDCGAGVHHLDEQLAPFQLPVLVPDQVTAFLGGRLVEGRSLPAPQLVGFEARAWAAACALSPYPLDAKGALALRQHLRLSVSPWHLRTLQAEAQPQAGRFVMPNEVRAQHLRWLCESEDLLTLGRVPPLSLLGRALGFFRLQLREEDRERRANENTLPWKATPAEQELQAQQALLELWDEPKRAVAALYRLFGSGQRTELNERLANYAPADCLKLRLPVEAILLPWKWDSLLPIEQELLLEMGLGRRVVSWHPRRSTLSRPARIWLAAGACTGMMMMAAVSLQLQRSGPLHEPTLQPSALPAGAWAEVFSGPDGVSYLTAGSARNSVLRPLARGAAASLRWSEQALPCRTNEADGREVWRCGTSAQPTRPTPPWPRERHVWLVAQHREQERRALATALLDSGSADQVIVHSALPGTLDLLPDSNKREVWILLDDSKFLLKGPPDVSLVASLLDNGFDGLTAALGSCRGVMPGDKVWGRRINIEWARAAAKHLLRCNECPYREWTDPKSGMVFVRACAGEFEMGSKEDDRDATANEKPAYPVRMPAFWIGKYEVSNAEYSKLEPEHRFSADQMLMPVTEVSWEEAKRFCESAGHRLPSEAEWEYAARGTDGRKYPWGNDTPNEELARFSKTLLVKNTPESVLSHPRGAGPFGTLNQAGNVWEWMQDCYQDDSYLARKLQSDNAGRSPISNPLAVEKSGCSRRVVRGGSFDLGPWSLRSAFRYRYVSRIRGGVLGFRCVRGSVRQP